MIKGNQSNKETLKEKTRENFKNMENIVKCIVCGAEEHLDKWNDETKAELGNRCLCFECNHWKNQHEHDMSIGEHDYAIYRGTHFRLLKEDPNAFFKGYGGAKFVFKFKDGTVKECKNVWCQGDIPDDYWRNIMPDNVDEVEFEQKPVKYIVK